MTLIKDRVPMAEYVQASAFNRGFRFHGWLYWDKFKSTDDTPKETVWMTRDRETSVHIIEDHYINQTYIVINGPNHKAITEKVRQHELALSETRILELLQQTAPEGQVELIVKLALAIKPPLDLSVVEVFSNALVNHDVDARTKVLEAMSYTDAEEFRELARSVAENDDDGKVRSVAQSLVNAYVKFTVADDDSVSPDNKKDEEGGLEDEQ